MNIKDIIKEKYIDARKYYETNKHTTECSYYMGYMDALGELLARIEQEEKKIPENNFNYIYSCEDDHIMANFENIKTTLKDIIDYLKSKGNE